MLAEIVILLGIANIVLACLIMRKLKEISYSAGARKNKKAETEEEDEEEETEPKDGVKEAKEKLERIRKEEEREKPVKKSKSKLGRFFGKKEEKLRPSLSEMPDMNRVIEELQQEFSKRAGAEAASVSRRKTGNEIEERLNEIEQM